jgi:hypothetical protein
MDDERDIELVWKNLEKAGLLVTPVDVNPSASVERCDLAAKDSCEKYLVEVKRINDEDNIKQELRNGQMFETTRSYVYRLRVAKEIHKAKKQLESTAEDYKDHLWLVALIAGSSYDPRFMHEQILGTLYGIGDMTDIEAGGERRRRRCLYFSESAFYKHPELDGAIVLGPDGIALYMNDYGRRLERVRRSGLACFLSPHDVVYDKETMESRCDSLIADFEMDRKDVPAVFARLQKKYSDRNLQMVNWQRWEGIANL